MIDRLRFYNKENIVFTFAQIEKATAAMRVRDETTILFVMSIYYAHMSIIIYR